MPNTRRGWRPLPSSRLPRTGTARTGPSTNEAALAPRRRPPDDRRCRKARRRRRDHRLAGAARAGARLRKPAHADPAGRRRTRLRARSECPRAGFGARRSVRRAGAVADQQCLRRSRARHLRQPVRQPVPGPARQHALFRPRGRAAAAGVPQPAAGGADRVGHRPDPVGAQTARNRRLPGRPGHGDRPRSDRHDGRLLAFRRRAGGDRHT